MKNMKVFIGAVFLSLMCVAGFAHSIEPQKQDHQMIQTASVKLEVKEVYKLDNAEYKAVVSTPTSFGSESSGTTVTFTTYLEKVSNLFGMAGLFDRQLILPALGVVAIVYSFFSSESEMALAAFPMIAFMRDKDGGSGNGNEGSEELKAIRTVAENVDKFNEELTKIQGGKADKGDLDKMAASLKGMEDNVGKLDSLKLAESLKAIQTELKEMGEDVARFKDGGFNGGRSVSKSIGTQIIEQLKKDKGFVDYAKDDGNVSKFGKGDKLNFDVNKTVADMTTANVVPVGTNSIPFSLASYETGLTRILKRNPWIMEIANVTPINTMYAQWAEQANQDGAANETAQAATKNQIDFDWVEKSQKVEKITAFIKVSKEALNDLAGLRGEIDAELLSEVMLKADYDLLNGDGSTPSLKGLFQWDTAFSAGNFAGTVRDPDMIAALRVAIAQVRRGFLEPNYILLHPDDAGHLDLEKGTDGHYKFPSFVSADNRMVSGVRVLSNTGQTAGTFTVGDFSKFNVRMREAVNIDMGYDGNDFTKNMITILAEIRLAAYVKTNHANAFVTGTFSNAIAAIDSGS